MNAGVMAQMVELSLSSKKKQLFLLEKMAWKGNVPPVGAAWNHWNQKSHSEFFINR